MKLYVIRRRNFWKTAADLQETARLSRRIGDEEMADEVRWIRSYVVKGADGRLGTVCIYRAVSPEALRRHANRAGMPADEIVPISARVVVRDDPAVFGYVIRRRNFWMTAADLEATAARSRQVGDKEMPDKVKWIRSYVVNEADGRLGTVCIYQATSPEAIREHASRVGMPADQIVPIAARVVVRPDPEVNEEGLEAA